MKILEQQTATQNPLKLCSVLLRYHLTYSDSHKCLWFIIDLNLNCCNFDAHLFQHQINSMHFIRNILRSKFFFFFLNYTLQSGRIHGRIAVVLSHFEMIKKDYSTQRIKLIPTISNVYVRRLLLLLLLLLLIS